MENECCPKFDPKSWNGKVLKWRNKKFVKGKVATFLHMPLNFGSVITKLNKKVEEANANVPDWLCLSDHTSKWSMNLYLAVDKDVPDVENTTLSGNFLSKVYEGPFKDTGKWCQDFEAYAKSKKLSIKKWYMWYTTCPKCAKKYGKNYVAIICEVEQ